MKKNGFFVAAGILSILEVIGLVIGAIAMIGSLALLNASIDIGGANAEISEAELQAMRSMLIAFIIILVVLAVIAIFNATVYLKSSGKSYEEIHSHSGKIITVIVLSFLVGGLICGVVGLLGYILKSENETSSRETAFGQTSSTYNSSGSEDISKKLQQLKEMRDGGIISEEEYQKAREEVLKRF